MDEIRVKLMKAITRQQIVETRYNGELIRLAPHLLFERHGDLFVRALNLNKNWRADDEPRLGQFKLAGLGGAEVLDETFEALLSYQPSAPRVGDTLVLSI